MNPDLDPVLVLDTTTVHPKSNPTIIVKNIFLCLGMGDNGRI